MSSIQKCPTCGGFAKTVYNNYGQNYQSVQENEIFLKVSQVKLAMLQYKQKAEKLEIELEELKRQLDHEHVF